MSRDTATHWSDPYDAPYTSPPRPRPERVSPATTVINSSTYSPCSSSGLSSLEEAIGLSAFWPAVSAATPSHAPNLLLSQSSPLFAESLDSTSSPRAFVEQGTGRSGSGLSSTTKSERLENDELVIISWSPSKSLSSYSSSSSSSRSSMASSGGSPRSRGRPTQPAGPGPVRNSYAKGEARVVSSNPYNFPGDAVPYTSTSGKPSSSTLPFVPAPTSSPGSLTASSDLPSLAATASPDGPGYFRDTNSKDKVRAISSAPKSSPDNPGTLSSSSPAKPSPSSPSKLPLSEPRQSCRKPKSKSNEEPRVRRPANQFIDFRSNFVRNHPDRKDIPQQKLSELAADAWKALSESEKEHWRRMAVKKSEEHRTMNPGYKFQPVSKKRRRSSGEGDDELEEGKGEGRKRVKVGEVGSVVANKIHRRRRVTAPVASKEPQPPKQPDVDLPPYNPMAVDSLAVVPTRESGMADADWSDIPVANKSPHSLSNDEGVPPFFPAYSYPRITTPPRKPASTIGEAKGRLNLNLNEEWREAAGEYTFPAGRSGAECPEMTEKMPFAQFVGPSFLRTVSLDERLARQAPRDIQWATDEQNIPEHMRCFDPTSGRPDGAETYLGSLMDDPFASQSFLYSMEECLNRLLTSSFGNQDWGV